MHTKTLCFGNTKCCHMKWFALILSVGILIDGAIIVVEYANRRASEGIGKKEVFILFHYYYAPIFCYDVHILLLFLIIKKF